MVRPRVEICQYILRSAEKFFTIPTDVWNCMRIVLKMT